MNILVFDNYDSFTYNLVHYVEDILNKKVDVFRNDEISVADAKKYDAIILSPGPGIPSEAGLLIPLIKELGSTHKILGVCLGLQAMAEAFGGSLINLDNVFHGVATNCKLTENTSYIFKQLPANFEVGRYHSWVADKNTLPNEFEITAVDDDGIIMAIQHKEYDLQAVQFHPESVLTPLGKQIIKNWLEHKK